VRATKILATLGPASDSPEGIRRLLTAGANAFRLNFSHGTEEEHRATLERVHRIVDDRPEPVAIVADLQGPKIRIGDLAAPHYTLKDQAELTLDTDPAPGDGLRIPVTLPELTRVVRPGDPLLLGDGSVELVVTAVQGASVRTRVVHGGALAAHAGLFLPRAKLRPEILGPKDRADLALALEGGVDFIAVSFVRDGADLLRVRREIARRSPRDPIGLIAKIERAEALRHFSTILEAADAIMVARGDLGIEVPLERLALEQKELVRRSNAAARPVIVATQMLLSMVNAPRPTRAEATDVANAVLDGADAVMLSEESAVGQFPAEAVAWLDRIARATEGSLDPDRFDAVRGDTTAEGRVAASAVGLARSTGARAIVTPTHSGRTARLVARHRPPVPIWAFTSSAAVRRQLALSYGVRTFPSAPHESLADMRRQVLTVAARERLRRGSIVLTAGFPVEGTPTNLVTLVGLGPPPRRRPAGRAPGRRARRRGGAAASRG
jgi:pyruvate kinase